VKLPKKGFEAERAARQHPSFIYKSELYFIDGSARRSVGRSVGRCKAKARGVSSKNKARAATRKGLALFLDRAKQAAAAVSAPSDRTRTNGERCVRDRYPLWAETACLAQFRESGIEPPGRTDHS
jgi:hypothetical protein